jgi:hypothetical protein
MGHSLICGLCHKCTVAELIVESYHDSTVNAILEDIGRKYKIDTTKNLLNQDSPVDEIKFKYRTYTECVRMLYKKAGVA